MKKRYCFVSNSSSSSFAILCQPKRFEEIKSLKNIYVIGDYFEEGLDYFPLTKEIFNYLKKHKDDGTLKIELKMELEFFEVFAESGEDGDDEVQKSSLPKKFVFKVITKDQNSTRDLDQFIENYVKNKDEVSENED
jgi:hypothetical protein